MKLHKSILALLPANVELNYVDYRDNLEGREEEIQKAVQSQEWSYLEESIWEAGIEQQWKAMWYIFEEFSEALQDAFGVDSDRAEQFIEDYRECLETEIYDRDTSTVMQDLIRNTGELVFFYDTGLEVGETCFLNDRESAALRQKIKKVLGIKAKESHWDSQIDIMTCQASYGGRLVVYFTARLDRVMELKGNRILFENPNIAIIDNGNGSGDDTELKGCKLSLPFDPANLFLDAAVKYSYTYDVCGMSSNWCNGTGFKIVNRGCSKKAVESSLHAHIDQEAQYDAKYRAGGCSFGDMKYNRHRDQYYINDFPCGNKCPHCGTFWID